MSGPSIPDRAAELMAKSAEVAKTIERIREADGEWTGFKLLANEAMSCAGDGLTRAWLLLDRMQSLADTEAARLKGKK